MRFFKSIIITIVFLLLIPVWCFAEFNNGIELTEAEKQWIAEDHIVKVRVSFFPPFHFNKNKLEGLSVDMITKIFNENNIKFELVSNADYSWSESLELIKRHEVFDMFLTASVSEERKSYLAFTENYIKIPWVIFTREDSPFISSIDDLEGKVISTPAGFVIGDILREHYPNLKLTTYGGGDEIKQCLVALSEGKVDAYIGSLAVGMYFIKNLGLANIKVVAPTPFGDHTQAFAVRNDWPELASIIDKSLEQFSPKLRDDIFNKWVSVNYEQGFNKIKVIEWVLTIILLFMIILFISFYWNKKLKREIKSRKLSEKKFNLLFQNNPSSVVLLDASDLTFVDINRMFTKLTGFTYEDVIGKTAYELRLLRDEIAKDGFARIMRKEGSFSNVEITFYTKEGMKLDGLQFGETIVIDEQKYYQISLIDVTEQKKAEEQISMLSRMPSENPHPVLRVNHNGMILYANNSSRVLLKAWKCSIDESLPTFLRELISDVYKDMTIHEIELEVDEQIFSLTIVPIVESKLLNIYGRDITERKQALKQISMLSRMPSENPHPVFRVSQDGMILYANNSSNVLLKAWNCSIGEKFPTFLCDLISGIYKNTTIKDIELKVAELIFSLVIVPIVDSGLVNIYGRDITERKQAEELLRESEAKLNALFSSLTEMIVMHELVINDAGEAVNYRIIDCNKAFTEITGISKEDAIGKLATEVYQTDVPPYLEVYSKVGLSREPEDFTNYYQPLDKHFIVSVVSPQIGKFATISTDITAMMQIQDIIVTKNKEMENYLYIASHDLRTPLVNIQGFSQRLKKQVDSIESLLVDNNLDPETLHQLANITDENIPKTLNFIFSNVEKMDILISGLLKLSRTGRMAMNIQKNDMNKLFTKICESLDFQIKEANCEINVNSLPECYGDVALLDQLFTNIISNALKYYDEERPLEITVDGKNIFNKVVYTIQDTGKGIAQQYLEKIWDIFYSIDPKSGKIGEGIGLSLVKQIAEKHKGKVWVASEVNKGSVFYIELHNCKFTEI